jgi:hypothetical protein
MQPHLAMGNEPGYIEKAHRKKDEPDCNRKHARRETEAMQRERKSWRSCMPRKRLGKGGRVCAAFASSGKV